MGLPCATESGMANTAGMSEQGPLARHADQRPDVAIGHQGCCGDYSRGFAAAVLGVLLPRYPPES